MIDTIVVSLALAAGFAALPGVPLRCWMLATGQLQSQIPPHALARATFSVFTVLFFVPCALAWSYALYTGVTYLRCTGACAQAGTSAAFAVGMLGGAYILLEGFLITARRRIKAGEP